MLDESVFKKFFGARIKTDGEVLVFPVDYKMSQQIQELDFNHLQHKAPYFARGIIGRIKKQAFENIPSIINYNLTRDKSNV